MFVNLTKYTFNDLINMRNERVNTLNLDEISDQQREYIEEEIIHIEKEIDQRNDRLLRNMS